MIEIAKKNCSRCDNITFIQNSFENYNFNSQFDIIIGGFMLSYFKDLKKSFNKINKLLKDNGYAIFSMLYPVKLSLVSKNENNFCLNNYFDENDYQTDLSFRNDKIELKKWALEDIAKATKENNLYIDDLLEPKPEINIGIDNEDFEFYHRCPSIIVFKFRKRN